MAHIRVACSSSSAGRLYIGQTALNISHSFNSFVRIGHLNQPITFLKADVGREMYFGDDSDDHSSSSFDYQGHEGLTYPGCSQDNLDDLFAAHFSRHMRSSLSMRLRKEDLQRDFRISLKIRTFDQDGLIFASVVRIYLSLVTEEKLLRVSMPFQNNKNLLVLYLQDTELRAEYHRRGSSDVSDVEVAEIEVADLFDNGLWKTLTLVKADTQLMLTVETDGEGKKTAAVATKVPKKLHINRHIWIGGVDVNDRRRVAGNESGYQYLVRIDGGTRELTCTNVCADFFFRAPFPTSTGAFVTSKLGYTSWPCRRQRRKMASPGALALLNPDSFYKAEMFRSLFLPS